MIPTVSAAATSSLNSIAKALMIRIHAADVGPVGLVSYCREGSTQSATSVRKTASESGEAMVPFSGLYVNWELPALEKR